MMTAMNRPLGLLASLILITLPAGCGDRAERGGSELTRPAISGVPVAQVAPSKVEDFYGTSGTVEFFDQIGIDAHMLRKVQEGSPNVIDLMRKGGIQLIINTPADKQSRQDHYQIMRAAVDYSVPYITTIQAARAAAMAIDAIKKEKITLEPLGHYLKGI